jgi:serine/threonine protein kinase
MTGPASHRVGPPRNPLAAFRIDYAKDYEELSQVHSHGKSGSSSVVLVRDLVTTRDYAAKHIAYDRLDEQGRVSLAREIQILATVNHGALLCLRGEGECAERKSTVILTDYMVNGPVNAFREQHPEEFTPTVRMIVLIGIASGMHYLHSHHILHRDLKPGNILLSETLTPAIADFGFAKYEDPNTQVQGGAALPTNPYMAPELFEKVPQYSTKSDVYAFGMVIYYLFTFSEPDPADLEKIVAGRSKFPASVPGGFQELIAQCWAPTPGDRPAFREILKNLVTSPEFYDYVDIPAVLDYARQISPVEYGLASLTESITSLNSVSIVFGEVLEESRGSAGRLTQLTQRHRKLAADLEAAKALAASLSAPAAPGPWPGRFEFPFDAPVGLLGFASQEPRCVVRLRKSSCDPAHVLNDNPKAFFRSADAAPNNWIRFEFTKRRSVSRLVLTSVAKYALKSWRLVAVLRDRSSKVLYESIADEAMNAGTPSTIEFAAVGPRSLTIEQTGRNWAGGKSFGLVMVVFAGPPESPPINAGDLVAVSNEMATIHEPGNSACLKTFSYNTARSWIQLSMVNARFSVTGYRLRDSSPDYRYTLQGSDRENSGWEAIPTDGEMLDHSILKVTAAPSKPYRFVRLELCERAKFIAINHLEFFGTWTERPSSTG